MIIRVFLFLTISIADFANDLCWTKEKNPATKQPYSSYKEWEADVHAWKQKQTVQLNVIQLARAYSVYKIEKEKANSFGYDKIAHCYIGCRVSQVTNYKTAQFMAWYKEMQDITDCSLESHFEHADYDATLIGAEAGKNKSILCEDVCSDLINQ